MSKPRRFTKRMERLLRDAEREGVLVAYDVDTQSLRFISKRDIGDEPDLRTMGEAVEIPDQCGGHVRFGADTDGSTVLLNS